jgi:predicted membrane protein
MKPGRLVLGLIILLIGLGWFLQAAGVVDRLAWDWILPAVLIVVGAALIADAKGRSHGGLIALGIIITIILMSGAAGRTPITTGMGIGDRNVGITSVAEMKDVSMFAGDLVVDLRDLDLLEGTNTLNVSVFAGQIMVYTPRDATVEVKASTLFGEINAFGETRSGVGVNLNTTSPGTGPTLVLKVSAFAGEIGVSR